jgi:mannose-6-phosphate isomerase
MGVGSMSELLDAQTTPLVNAEAKTLLNELYGTTVLPIKVEKPWGYELVYACTEKYVGKILHVKKGHILSLQYHNHKQESNLLQKGKLELVKGPNMLEETTLSVAAVQERLVRIQLEAGDTWTNMPGDVHTIKAIEDSDVLEVSTPELGDVVRLQDTYGREGTSKP